MSTDLLTSLTIDLKGDAKKEITELVRALGTMTASMAQMGQTGAAATTTLDAQFAELAREMKVANEVAMQSNLELQGIYDHTKKLEPEMQKLGQEFANAQKKGAAETRTAKAEMASLGQVAGDVRQALGESP